MKESITIQLDNLIREGFFDIPEPRHVRDNLDKRLDHLEIQIAKIRSENQIERATTAARIFLESELRSLDDKKEREELWVYFNQRINTESYNHIRRQLGFG
jgi:hypothetical protein